MAPSTAGQRKTLRLAPHVRPREIELDFDLDPGKRHFEGRARYAIDLDQRCREIELHAVELEVSDVSIRILATDPPGRARRRHTPTRPEATQGTVPVLVRHHPECETIVLETDRAIPKGPIEVELRFRGRVRDDLRGLYRSTDRDAPWIATQLCPTDARRFFPCFDEPGTKASYSIRVTAPADQTVLSNAPIARRSRPDRKGLRTTTFAPTPPLSAYLVAVSVGPFEASRPAHCGDTPIRVYTLPGRKALGRFARRAAVESLSRLERWFGMPHPYAKLDLVALPDFAFGAMENAGAVFFRDSVLLLDERESSVEDQMRAAETIAHELSHMWFGNLVTMAWWNDLWLNESFATWMAYEIVHDWQPDWRIWLEFVQRREGALEVDALKSSHPIAPPIRTAEEAHENFDAITYTKGASVLRMLERYLGARVFRDGVRRYVCQHQQGSATASDLWSALSDASGLPIERIVAPWTLETGYPIVEVSCHPTRGGGARVELEQSRFLMRSSATGKEVRWTIPWVGRAGHARRSTEVKHLLSKQRDSLRLEPPAPDWLYANGSESGFFRIDHGAAGFDRVLGAAARLSPLEKVGWIGHQWALVRSGRAPIDSVLEAIAHFGGDEDPDVLASAERVLTQILCRLAPACAPATSERLQAWIADGFSAQLESVGFEGSAREPAMRRRQRARLVSILGGLAAAPAVVEACHRSVAEHFESGATLPVGLADEVLHIAATTGDRRLQPKLLEAVRNADTPQARRRNLFALAGDTRPAALRVTLRASLDPALAPAVDRATLLMRLLGSPQSAARTWAHLQQHWPRFEREMPPILLARIVGECSRALPVSSGREIRAFFRQHPLAAGARVIDQVTEELAIARRLRAHAGRALEAYLKR